MNSELISSLESGPNISDQKELIGFPKNPDLNPPNLALYLSLIHI